MESGLHFHGQGVTRPYLIIHASSHIHGQTSPNIIHGEHFESTVNKRMRLTRSSIHCEEKVPYKSGAIPLVCSNYVSY
jgi:hypothetical protein